MAVAGEVTSDLESPRRSRSVALVAMAGVIVVGPELIGGRPGWAVTTIAVAASLAAITAGLSVRRGVGSSLAESVPLLAVVGALVWTSLQCLPLPIAWVASVNADGVDDTRQTALLLGAPTPSWLPLSRSPWSTVEQVVRGTAIVGTFAAVWWHSIARRREVIAAMVGVSTIVMAVVTLVHHALGATSIFGLYHPVVMGRLPSPLLNENHVAGFLAMGIPLLIALGLEAQRPSLRTAWWLGAAVSSATSILSISRSGLGGLAVGLFVVVALHRNQARHWARGRWLAAATLVVGFAVLLAVALSTDELWDDLSTTNLEKLRLAIRGLDLVAQRPWLGVGRGAYSEAFVRLYGTAERIEQPENIVVQWASEWGLPAAITLLFVLSRAWLMAARTRSVVRWGALAGIASIVAHDNLDFATETTGIAVVASALLAMAVAPSNAVSNGTRATDRRMPIALGGIGLVLCATLGLQLDARRPREIEERLRVADASHDFRRFDEEFVRGAALHPGEPALPLLRAHVGLQRGDRDTGRWLNRAMLLAPGWSSPHLVAAEWLIAHRAFDQAWLELREAETRLPGSSQVLACELANQSAAVDEALRVFADHTDSLDRVAACPHLAPDAAARIDNYLVENTTLPAPRIRVGVRALARGDADAAVSVLRPLASSTDATAVITLATSFRAAGHPRDAVDLLESHAWEPAAHGQAYLELARAYADLGDAAQMRETIDRLRASAGGSGTELASVLMELGALELQLGNEGHALHAFEQAMRLAPSSQALGRIATTAETLGDRGRAFRAWSDLCRDSGDSTACAAAARLGVAARDTEHSLRP